MKLLIYSDLHLEAAAFTPDPELVEDANLVILAGDIATGVDGIRWAAQTFPHLMVLYVPGNHEYFGEHRPSMLEQLRQAAWETLNVRVMDNEAINYGGVCFLGATLWTDYELHVPEGADRHARDIDRVGAMNEARRALNDYKLIYERLNAQGLKAKRGLVQPYDLYELHQASRAWLSERLAQLRESLPHAPRVVITHHAPAAESLGRWDEKPTSPAYASRLPPELVGSADLWIHGHIHDPVDYVHYGCRVLSNPRGYPDRKGQLLGGQAMFDNAAFGNVIVEISRDRAPESWSESIIVTGSRRG